MRIDNEDSLSSIADALGIEDSKNLMRRRLMGTGYRVLLTGPWAGHAPIAMFPAPRRTMEGGGSLDLAQWATPRPAKLLKRRAL